jgi:hypothetical protein
VPRQTGAAVPWLRAQDAALRAAVREHGRAWETIRALVEDEGEFPPLFVRLGAPESKCLRKRWDKLQEMDALGMVPAYPRG